MNAREHHFRLDLDWTGRGGRGRPLRINPQSRGYPVRSSTPLRGSADPTFRGVGSGPCTTRRTSGRRPGLLPHARVLAEAAAPAWWSSPLSRPGRRADDLEGGHGQFARVILRPLVVVAAGTTTPRSAPELHHRAHGWAFIARSVNFPSYHEAAVDFAVGPRPPDPPRGWGT